MPLRSWWVKQDFACAQQFFKMNTEKQRWSARSAVILTTERCKGECWGTCMVFGMWGFQNLWRNGGKSLLMESTSSCWQCLPLLFSRQAEGMPCRWHARCCKKHPPAEWVRQAGATRTLVFNISYLKNYFYDIFSYFFDMENRLSVHTTDDVMWAQRPTKLALLLKRSPTWGS